MLWYAIAALAAVLVALLKPTTGKGYVNGSPVTLVLGSIGACASGEDVYLRADAAVAFDALRGASSLALGREPVASGPRAAFRTPEQQASLVSSLGSYATDGLAAAVGHSPHQAGIAVDVLGMDEKADDYDAELCEWLKTNCHRFCWHNAGDFFAKKEPWHFEYKPALFNPVG